MRKKINHATAHKQLEANILPLHMYLATHERNSEGIMDTTKERVRFVAWFLFLIIHGLFSGCAITSIREVTEKDGTNIKTAWNGNLFTNKHFDSLSATVGETSVKAGNYASDIDSEAIDSAGGAVGTITGKAIKAATL